MLLLWTGTLVRRKTERVKKNNHNNIINNKTDTKAHHKGILCCAAPHPNHIGAHGPMGGKTCDGRKCATSNLKSKGIIPKASTELGMSQLPEPSVGGLHLLRPPKADLHNTVRFSVVGVKRQIP